MSGGGGTTSSTSNRPPQEYIDQYNAVMARANQVANTPYEQYQGKLQADFSPMQEQAFSMVGSTPGMTAPYINAAAQNFADASADLKTSYQPQMDQAGAQYQRAADSNLPGAIAPWQSQAQQGFAAGAQSINPTQYSGDAIKGFESPYTNDVVNATQAQFNQQNAQAQTALQGNAASKGALGGDRLGVAQAQLAGQQQMAQAPVLANLRNQGFAQAQQEFNQQQQTNLGAQQNTAGRQLQGAQGMAGLGNQSLQAAQGQAGVEQAAGQGFAGLGQLGLSGAQSQGWLNAQAGQGMAGLGNQALSNTLNEATALQGVGGQQQAFAQQSLNIPYQQFLAKQAFPYQQTGWLANIALGLGSGAGTNSTSTAPGPSAGGQIAGLGTAAGGLGLAAYNSGLFSGAGAGSYGAGSAQGLIDAGATDVGAAGFSDAALANTIEAAAKRGGAVRGFAGGGEVPDLSINGVPAAGLPGGLSGGLSSVSAGPGSVDVTEGGSDVPDVSGSPIPSGSIGRGTALLKRDYGSTSHTSVPHDSTIGSILKTAGAIAATVYGGPAGGMAANALGSQVHFNRGGFARAPGGSVPVLPQGFAAGDSAPIAVTTVANARGRGVPTLTVNPQAGAPSVPGGGSTLDQMHAYLAKQASQGGQPAPPPPPPAAAAPAAPTGPTLTPEQTQQLQQFLKDKAENDARMQLPQTGGSEGGAGMARGGFTPGFIRGFDDGGDVGSSSDDENWFTEPGFKRLGRAMVGPDMGHVTNRPVGAAMADWWRDPNAPPPDPNAPGWLARHSTPGLTPDKLRAAWNAIPGFPAKVADDARGFNQRFTRETAPSTETDLSDPVPTGIPPSPDKPRDAPAVTDPWASRGSGATVDDAPPDLGFAGQGARGLGMTSLPGDPTDSAGPPSAPAGGFDKTPARPASPPPAAQPGFAGPETAKPDPSAANAPGAIDKNHYPDSARLSDASDELRGTRALREDHASIPLALLTAGFGMMASRSPHAMQAIGEGALGGVQQYVSADRAAKELAAKVDENRVRLKETQAYRDATSGINQQKADAQTSRAKTYAAAQIAKANVQALQQANPKMTYAEVLSRTMKSMTDTVNPETGQNFTDSEAWVHLRGLDIKQNAQAETVRHNQAGEQNVADRNQINLQRVLNSKAAKDTELELRRQGMDDARIKDIMHTAGTQVTSDLTGKKDLHTEVQRQLSERGNLGDQPAAAPTTTAPVTLDAARAAIAAGADRTKVIARVKQAGLDPTGL